MAGRHCKNCGAIVEDPGPAYCNDACWDTAAARRRPIAAARSRARRTAAQAANTTISTDGAVIVTRVWVNGQVFSEQREPIA